MELLFYKNPYYYIGIFEVEECKDSEECSICLDNNVNCKLKCGHIFHSECITQIKTPFCPYCRKEIDITYISTERLFEVYIHNSSYRLILHILLNYEEEKILNKLFEFLVIIYTNKFLEKKLLNKFIKILFNIDGIISIDIQKFNSNNETDYIRNIYDSTNNLSLDKIKKKYKSRDYFDESLPYFYDNVLLYEKCIHEFIIKQNYIRKYGYSLIDFLDIFHEHTVFS